MAMARLLMEENDEVDDNIHLGMLMHPYNSAVYSSLVEIDETASSHESLKHVADEHNQRVEEFNSQRHISRHELFLKKNTQGLNYFWEDMEFWGGKEENRTRNLRVIQDGRRILQAEALPPLISAEDREAKDGGLYREFQSAPLSQGYGTHYATLWVGTPTPQRKTLIVDTGSHHTAFPCKGCHRCGERHHTDKYFDPDSSKSFRPLTCRECRWGASCEKLAPSGEDESSVGEEVSGCVFQQAYTEGSSWRAFQVQDRVFCGGKDVFSAADPIAQRYSFDFTFGCQTFSSGLFVSQLADGIMGLSQHDATLPRVMYNQGKLNSRMFGLCFRTEMVVSKKGISAGVLTLGGIDTRLDSSPMVFAKNLARSGWFTVYVKKVYLRPDGGQSARSDSIDDVMEIPADIYAMNSGKGVIIDSGTTDTYLHKSLSKPFNDAWKSVTGKPYSNAPQRLTREQLMSLPTIMIQLMPYSIEENADIGSPDDIIGLTGTKLDENSPHDVLLAVPATHYMEYSPSKDVYTSRFYFTETRGGVIGANSLQGHNVVFDWEYGRIGFAESNCKINDPREEVAGLVSEGADARGVDCILQNPAIAESCASNVESSVCTADNPDEILEGVERWTMVVDYPGTSSGLGCSDVIRKKMLPNPSQSSPLDVNCNDAGLCTSNQKCEIACRYIRPVEPQPEQEETAETNLQCSGSVWGACLETCQQAKIGSTLMSDGRCYEDQSKREERECHTEYCGMSDPCLIPFVVHVILAIRGVDSSTWDRESESTIIDAFSASVKNMQGEQIFKPSDVELLMVSPWHQQVVDVGVGDTGEMSELLGTKIVMEIHMYNTNAVDPTSQKEDEDDSQDISERITAILRSTYKSSNPRLSECKSSDIFELAQVAHEIHFVLREEDFMHRLGKTLSEDARVEAETSSSFSNMAFDEALIDGSIVFSSWTIKTEIGGGSVYDHQLDPYPGALHYVKVGPAYFSFIKLSTVSYAALGFVIVMFIKRRRVARGNGPQFFEAKSEETTFCAKPFEIVKRRCGKTKSFMDLRRKRDEYEFEEVDTESTTDSSSEKELDHFPGIIANAKTRSRLSDIIVGRQHG
eukprot:CAMPEP_0194121030 /NCGR_PEP_ID=MMETSP0150-20130528/45431_1 /TAXON_ID=122233 /ORGANISM="Chaetoceros debilis, Strain MM31A-1" /LENGTH=1086 /DNA_ID=CAMNT_0038813319 /DNA_START=182 /DNA_END=3441 /DNA_ORIENTATION=+